MSADLPVLLALLLASPAAARVVSYAPVTDRIATPVQQVRTNPEFVLIEAKEGGWAGPIAGPSDGLPFYSWLSGRLVIHDATGAREARVVLPAGGPEAAFTAVAARRGADGALRIVALTNTDPSGTGPRDRNRLLFTSDGGATWKELAVPAGLLPAVPNNWGSNWSGTDFGGPVARGRDPVLRLGSDASPFLLLLARATGGGGGALVAIDDEGLVRPLAEFTPWDENGGVGARLVGTSRDGGAVLVVGRVQPPGAAGPGLPPRALWKVLASGGVEKLLDLGPEVPAAEGWLTPRGAAYLEIAEWRQVVPAPFRSHRALYLVEGGEAKEIAAVSVSGPDWGVFLSSLFAIPTADYEGAWLLRRGLGKPTVLARHTPAGGLVEKWSDPTAPEVEALHAGSSGQKLLVQVHRPRPQMDQRLFKDPALAVWEEGQPAPRTYDELFLVEETNKGFVHLDVETVVGGAPFVFDSGGTSSCVACGGAPSGDGGAGGADVVQEWGVVKASLRQRLVIPAVARAEGAGGAFWKTDLLLGNPAPDPLHVELRYVPRGSEEARETAVSLAPREIRLVPDVLSALFGLGTGAGALFVTPEGTRVVSATSRTWTASGAGSFGMSMSAVDLLAASSVRFPLSFAGALPGAGYRTNAGGVDVAGRGATVGLRFASESGWAGRSDLTFQADPGGTTQIDRLASWLGVEPWRGGALEYAPVRGEVVPFVTSIDETTNDPTYWRPDLPASVARAIPALVHADGRNGARFRSDLFLYNDNDALTSVTLAAKPWNSTAGETIVTLTLLPREAKVVRDALSVVFRQAGVARLRFISNGAGAGTGVRATSRTYTVRPDGGTYGVPLPPLNAFQMAGAGEALELFGVLGGPSFRTNLALVDMSAFADGKTVRVRVEVIGTGGGTLDSFDVNVPVAGGIQVDDVFRARGLGDGPPAALLRVTPFGGLVGAYATSIDQGTNDAILISAALAARD
ncbi:MAG: hypothetical protein IPL90_02115 [Holophagales bacterium]|nr:hypothetical protein [Holophagales bacterium]